PIMLYPKPVGTCSVALPATRASATTISGASGIPQRRTGPCSLPSASPARSPGSWARSSAPPRYTPATRPTLDAARERGRPGVTCPSVCRGPALDQHGLLEVRFARPVRREQLEVPPPAVRARVDLPPVRLQH